MNNELQISSSVDLVNRCHATPYDENVWREFFSYHYSFIYVTSKKYYNKHRRYLKLVEIDDIIQESSRKMVLAIRRGYFIRQPDSFYGYLATIIKNTVHDFVRKNPPESQYLEMVITAEDAHKFSDPEHTAKDYVAILKPHISNAANNLSARYFQIIKLKMAGETNKTIQNKMNVRTAAATKQVIHRAMKSFRMKLRRELKKALESQEQPAINKDTLKTFLSQLEQS